MIRKIIYMQLLVLFAGDAVDVVDAGDDAVDARSGRIY